LEDVEPLYYKSANNVEFLDVTLAADGTAISSITDCIAKLYDDNKDDKTVADAASGANVIQVSRIKKFAVGDTIIITQDDETDHDGGLITVIDSESSTLTFTTVTTDTCAAGRVVKVKLGANVTMTLFGTPVPGQEDWGFRGIITAAHSNLYIGQQVRIEIEFDGGANKERVILLRTNVVGGS